MNENEEIGMILKELIKVPGFELKMKTIGNNPPQPSIIIGNFGCSHPSLVETLRRCRDYIKELEDPKHFANCGCPECLADKSKDGFRKF